MASLRICLVVLCCCAQTIYGQNTIQDILLQRPELSKLLEFSRDTQSFAAFGQRDARFTLFAPTNGAFERLSPALTRGWSGNNEQAKEQRQHLVQYHSIREKYTRSELENTRKESQARDAPKLFIRSRTVGQETNVYVNGARFLGEITAGNGIVYVIDAVLYPIASKKNALALLEDSGNDSKDNRRAMKFFELLERAQYYTNSPYQYLNSDSLFVTVFVPTDVSIRNILTGRREEELLQDREAVVNLLNRHVLLHRGDNSRPTEMDVSAVAHATVLNDAIDGAILSGEPAIFKALHGQIQPVRIANTLFVTNECGMVKVMDLPRRPSNEDEEGEDEESRYEIELPSLSSSRFPVEANVTVNNGVIHFVDGLLGYIYNDAISMLEEDEDISKFRDTIQMSPSFVDQLTVRSGNVIRDSDKLTIFAPIDAAFTNLEAAGNIDLSQDDERREGLLNMHMLRGVLNLVDIGNDTRKQTLEPTTTAKFYVDRTGTYVEVDRVRARIVKADVCVKNGIIHYIDNLLGMPYRNLLDEIQALEMLSDLDEAILQTPQFIEGNRDGLRTIKSILEDTDSGPRTLFAPNKDAFRKMRNTEVGRNYMDTFNARKLYYLILRHAPAGEFYIEDDITGKVPVPNSDGLSVFKDGDDYFVEYTGPFGSVQAKFLQRNVRLTNGVIHIIDSVLYIDSTQAFDTVGSSTVITPSILLLAACVFKYFL